MKKVKPGLLLVDKPDSMTSHDVVDRIRRLLGIKKIGHTGTLDRSATGLLVLLIGEATKLAPFLQNMDKTYEAEVVFGIKTTTDDSTGQIISETDCSELSQETLINIIGEFTGGQLQQVPRYSSVKVEGKKLYQRAVAGEDFEPPVKKITVYNIKVTDFKMNDHPVAKIEVHCSKGTYVRALARDIGKIAGCGAHIGSLKRTALGNMKLSEALSLDELEKSGSRASIYIKDIGVAIEQFQKVRIVKGKEFTVKSGKLLKADDFEKIGRIYKGTVFAVTDIEGRLLAMLEAKDDFGKESDILPAKYLRVFNL